MSKFDIYKSDCDYLLSNGWSKECFTYKIPDDENYEDIFVKGDVALVWGYYYPNTWHEFKYSDASYINGLPDNYKRIDIYETTI